MKKTAETPKKLITRQREYFQEGHTRSLEFRLEKLALKKAIENYEERILAAVKLDLGKPNIEGFLSETAFTIAEIDLFLKKLKSWAKPKKVATPLAFLPGSSRIYSEPYGIALIIGPWNYPFNLAIVPGIGAIAAGNCVVIKPSEVTPNTSRVIFELFQEYFDREYIAVVEGGAEKAKALLREKWDYIFYTGGSAVGKKIMAAAAKHLTPVTLELGGKSPCIIDKNVPMKTVARRIAWGKFFNAGQTCVAPDYVLVEKSVKTKFVAMMREVLLEFFGDNPQESPDLARIVNNHHFQRLTKLLKNTQILVGGETDRKTKYIAPTLIDEPSWKQPVLQEEIFGPILPILEYETLDEALQIISRQPKPLALYFFTKDRSLRERVLTSSTSGGACINDAFSHIVPNKLPFGGVGNSGTGNYHGKASFDTFSHQKSALKRSLFPDIKDRYAPYTLTIKKAKMLIKFMTG